MLLDEYLVRYPARLGRLYRFYERERAEEFAQRCAAMYRVPCVVMRVVERYEILPDPPAPEPGDSGEN